MAPMLGGGITRNHITGREQPAQMPLPTNEIGGSIKYSIGIANPFRTETENWTDPTIQPTIFHFNQVTGPVYSDRNLNITPREFV